MSAIPSWLRLLPLASLALPGAAADVDELRGWFAPEPTPVAVQGDVLAEAVRDGSWRWRSDADAACRLGAGEASLQGAVAGEGWRHAPALPDGTALPRRLGLATVGGGLRGWSDGGAAAGIHGQLIASGEGAPGSQPFADADADAFVRLPFGQHDALLALARYATQRMWWRHDLLPGAGWEHEAGDLWFLLGFPLSALSWQADPDLRITAAVGDPWHVGVDYRLGQTWSIGLAGDWRSDGYRRGDRRGGDLLVSEDLRLAGTITVTPRPWCEFDASVGWFLQRRLRVVDGATGQSTDVAEIRPGAGVGLGAYLYF